MQTVLSRPGLVLSQTVTPDTGPALCPLIGTPPPRHQKWEVRQGPVPAFRHPQTAKSQGQGLLPSLSPQTRGPQIQFNLPSSVLMQWDSSGQIPSPHHCAPQARGSPRTGPISLPLSSQIRGSQEQALSPFCCPPNDKILRADPFLSSAAPLN